ncbi:MAG TPA: hypothetical protein VII06_37090 [Chloroflexota bacterium]|jgi:predicted ABC-type transport system involved in lysophospholipase L1 biosynthesis ATPase subunit
MIQLRIPRGVGPTGRGTAALLGLLAGLDLTILGAIVAAGMLLGE